MIPHAALLVVRSGVSRWPAMLLATLVIPELLALVARWVLVPLGLYRAAYYAGSVGALSTWRDAFGAGLWMAARAIVARGGRPDPSALAWVEARRDERRYLGSGAVLASAILAAARGDREGARRMFESVEDFHPSVTPWAVRATAREWLAANAAGEGRWSDVLELARREGPCSRATHFLGQAAARLLGDPLAPDDTWLWVSWLVAPRRAALRPLFDRALACTRSGRSSASGADPRSTRSGASSDMVSETPVPIVDPLSGVGDGGSDPARALSLAVERHAALVRLAASGGPVGVSAVGLVVDAGRAWDLALEDRSTRALVERRALAHGARNADDVWRALPRVVAADVALCVERARLSIASVSSGSRTLEDATWRLRGEELERFEERCRELRQMIDRVKEPVEVWSRWCALRDAYERARALTGDDLAQYLFSEAYGAACNVAVRLHNEERQTALANAVFRWLLARAVEVDAEDAVDLLGRNAGVGP